MFSFGNRGGPVRMLKEKQQTEQTRVLKNDSGFIGTS